MKFEDLTGRTFTWLYVEGREGSTKQHKALWRCRCVCNKLVYAATGDLKSGKVTSCGCRKAYLARMRYKDEVGKIYNYLLVKECVESSNEGRALFKCECLRCGNETFATGKALRAGTKQSCGCLKLDYMKHFGERNFINLTGNTYGYLLVKSRAPNQYSKSGNQSTMWNCLCLLCGGDTVVAGTALTTPNHTRSCGCLKMSYAEKDISDELNKLNMNYRFNYIFPDLISPASDHPLRFDFALLNENNVLLALIEYQGPQHYFEYSGEFGAFQREVTDQMKKEYCACNDIKLYEIRFDDNIIEKLHKILEEVYNISYDNSVLMPIYCGKGVTTRYIQVAI